MNDNAYRLCNEVKGRFVISRETLMFMSFILFFSSQFIRLVLSKILGKIGMLDKMTICVICIIYTPLLLALLINLNRGLKKIIPFLFLLITVLLFFEITLLVHPEYQYWYSRETYGVVDTIFRPDKGGIFGFLFVAILASNKEKMIKSLKTVLVINFFMILYKYSQYMVRGYWQEINGYGETIQSSYSLDFGYEAVFIVLLSMLFCFIEKRKIYLIITMISSGVLILAGSRGPLIILTVSVSLLIIRKIFVSNSVKKFLYVFGIIAISLLIIFSLQSILDALSFVIAKYNISSRALQSIVSGTLTDDNGRNAIKDIVNSYMSNAPFFGFGAYGDRYMIGPSFNWGYCHNILLEFQVDFGKIPGTVCLIGILVVTLLKLKKYLYDIESFSVILLFFSMNIRLMVSGTFWGDKFFWGLLSIILFWKYVGGDSNDSTLVSA